MTSAAADASAATTPAERRLWLLVGLAVTVVTVAALAHVQANPVLGAVTVGLVIATWQRQLLAWPVLLGYVLVVILFIPIRRYTVGAGLPISLEPYRLLIAIVLAAWLAALLADPDVRARRTGLEGPIALIAIAIAASLALNVPRLTSQGLGADVVKQLSFFASFLLVMWFTACVVDSRRTLDRLLMLMTAAASVVAICTIYEWRTGTNVFDHLGGIIPLLHLDPSASSPLLRGGRIRAYASAQHPIALGAALVMLLPIAVYLWRRTQSVVWLGAAGLLTLAALATGSRTAALMLVTLLVVFLWLKRAETMRLLPLLLPLFICAQIAIPGTLGTFRAVILPQDGSVVQEQQGGAGTGTGRLADLGPSLTEWGRTPFFGQGFGTRLPSDADKLVNARILDDEWLAMLLEIGLVGVIGLVWLYSRSIRSLAARAKEDAGTFGWLLTGFAASLTAFAVGMFTYDAFSFIQVTFLSFVLIGLGCAALRLGPGDDPR